MNKIFAPFLPPWVETGLQPAFYDMESGTVLQQTARMYAKVQQLTRLFNELSEETKNEIETFETNVDNRVTEFETNVDNRVTEFENSVNATVQDYIDKFIKLKDFVDDYFDNLDVQKEIDHKLDEMLADGVLQEIIATYLDSNVAWTFDSIAEMKTATNLTSDSYAQTYGFYTVGDGGGAKYKIRSPKESETANNITTFDIVGGLIAELVITPSMNVKQFGAKGDNTTDDTDAIQTALNNVKNIEFTNDSYKVVCVVFKSNQTVEGNGATLNCELNTAALIGVDDNLTIKNITINCTNNDREWNRIDLRNHHDITFENCTISGFQQQTITPGAVGYNVWALYIRDCYNITVRNCNFVDNSFQDVIIEYGNYNIVFENCTGSYNNNEGMIIDIEPSATTGVNENITITNCVFREFDTYEYFNTQNSNKNITLNNCKINNLRYVGGDVDYNNCVINSFSPKQAVNFLNSDGVVTFKNSLHFSDNLIADPYFRTLSMTNDANRLWHVNYASTAWKTLAYRVKDSEGTYLALNPTNVASGNIIIETKQISASAGDVFMLKHISKAFYPTGAAGATANHINIKFYGSDDTLLDTYKLKTNRGATAAAQEFSERTNIFMCPENTSYFIINLRNGEISSANASYFKSIGLYKVTCSPERTNNVESLGDSEGKPFYGSVLFNSENNDVNHFAGEHMYYNTPSTYIGGVCTNATKNTWKEFGALAA